jgi:pimeloyl-ACP methyl ester carboxylesterase
LVKKLSLLFLGLLSFSAVLMFAWYQIDGIPADSSENYMSGTGYTAVEEDDGSLMFTPATNNGHGVVIMHGALILPKSYAKSAAYFAQLGYTIYVPNGPARMSIAVTEDTAERLNSSAIEEWFFIGHSMGGMASLEIISEYNIEAKAVALWATSMPSDYSNVEVPILFIWGDTDGLLPKERFRRTKENLPSSVDYVTLEGANHKNFAMYTHQFFDNEATIDWMEQIDFANETTAAYFSERL